MGDKRAVSMTGTVTRPKRTRRLTINDRFTAAVAPVRHAGI